MLSCSFMIDIFKYIYLWILNLRIRTLVKRVKFRDMKSKRFDKHTDKLVSRYYTLNSIRKELLNE